MASAALSQARDSMKDGHYWASCFFAHQAAEFAAKALLAYHGIEGRGHSVAEILRKAAELGVEELSELERLALNLDRHYLQSRYVNTFHAGAPIDYYTLEDAEKALDEASRVVRAVEA